MEWYWILFNDILFDKSLTDKQKLLSAYINSLCSETWFTKKTNKEIWDRFGVVPETISVNLSILQKKWIIHIEIQDLYDRTIYIGWYMKNLKGVLEKSKDTYNINIYNITEFDNYEENKEIHRNELYIIQKWMDLWIWFYKHELEKWCIRVKDMLSEFIPRREDWKIDWNIAKSYTNARYDYWENPPKGKKKPTNFKTSLRNNIEMRSRPKTRKK